MPFGYCFKDNITGRLMICEGRFEDAPEAIAALEDTARFFLDSSGTKSNASGEVMNMLSKEGIMKRLIRNFTL